MINQLSKASVGSPITRAGVSIFPVYLHQATPGFLTGPDSRLQVTERPGASVPTLVVTNPNGVPVLITEGETLNGGWQNRVVNVSVLVPADAELDIPVSCVEAGRWGGQREFGQRGPKAPRRVRRGATVSVTENLRHAQTRHSNQGAVWEAVDFELEANGIDAPTRAVEQLAERERRDHRLADAIAELVARGPLPGQCGIVVAHGRRVVAAEIYGSGDLLTAAWETLIRGYLLEARREPKGTPSATKALRFLEKASQRVVAVSDSVGLGREHRIASSNIAGQALTIDDLLVHASAFALAA
jgi:hypothetical protein